MTRTITDIVNQTDVETIRALLIDPEKRSVEEIRLHKESAIEHMYEIMNTDTVERIIFPNRSAQINLDEYDTFKEEIFPFILNCTYPVYPDVFVNKAIITGYDFSSLDELTTKEFIEANIVWLT